MAAGGLYRTGVNRLGATVTSEQEASPGVARGPQFFDGALKQPEFEFGGVEVPLEELLEKAIDAIADALQAALPATKASENRDWCAYFWPGYNSIALDKQAMRIVKRRKSKKNSDQRDIEGGYLLFNPEQDNNHSDKDRELAASIELGFHKYLSDPDPDNINSVGSTHNWLMSDDCDVDILGIELRETSAQEKGSERQEPLNKKFLQLVASSAEDIHNEIKQLNPSLPPWPATSGQNVDAAIQRYNLWFATFLDSTWRDNLNSDQTEGIESVRTQGKCNVAGEPRPEFFDNLKYWYPFAAEKVQDGNGELKSLGSGMLFTSHKLDEESLRIFRHWMISAYWALRASELTRSYRDIGISHGTLQRSRGLQHEMKDFAKSFIRILDFSVRDLGLESSRGCGSRVLQRVEHQHTKDRNHASLFVIPGDPRLYADMIAPLIPYLEYPVETLSRLVKGETEDCMALDELLRMIVRMCYGVASEEDRYTDIDEAIVRWLPKVWDKEELLPPEIKKEDELPIEVTAINSSVKKLSNKKFRSAEATPLMHALVPLVRNALKHWPKNNSKTTVKFECDDENTQSLQIQFCSELTEEGRRNCEQNNGSNGTAGAIRAALSWQEKLPVELTCFDFDLEQNEGEGIHYSVVTVNLERLCGK